MKVKESQTIKGGKMSKTISDIIEEFIVSSLDDDEFIELSRNDLAKFFSCVPSQINYVLNTRFTVNRGFIVESQRGGGGYIKVVRIQNNDDSFLRRIIQICENPMSITESNHILLNMKERRLITKNEMELIKSMITSKALNNPVNMDNRIRANIMREIAINLMNR